MYPSDVMISTVLGARVSVFVKCIGEAMTTRACGARVCLSAEKDFS